MRALLLVLGLVAGVVVLMLGLLWTFQRRLVYLPSTASVGRAAAAVPGAQDVTLRTSDGLSLGGWFVPARPAPERPGSGVTVLVAPGNGGDRSLRAPLARALSARGLGVLLFDYRGYGGNAGAPSEQGLARDVRAARSFLLGAGVPADRILLFGESLGAAVVTELAAEHPPGALLLRSPFVDLASVGRVHYPVLPVRTLLRDRFPLVEHLRSVNAPVTVVYGSRDSIVPASQSRRVAEAAPLLHRAVEVPGADHNDRVLLDGDVVVDAVLDQAREVRRGG